MHIVICIALLFISHVSYAASLDSAPLVNSVAENGTVLQILASGKGSTLHYAVFPSGVVAPNKEELLNPSKRADILASGNAQGKLDVEVSGLKRASDYSVFVIAKDAHSVSSAFRVNATTSNGRPYFTAGPKLHVRESTVYVSGKISEPSELVILLSNDEQLPESKNQIIGKATHKYDIQGQKVDVIIEKLKDNTRYYAYVLLVDREGSESMAINSLVFETKPKDIVIIDKEQSGALSRAVLNALFWFKKHQSDNGQWDVDGYMDNCGENPKCEPGTSRTADRGDGDCICTAFALLCFMGNGWDHKTPGKFKSTVAKGLDWLKSIQKKDGSFGKCTNNYSNALCTAAFCEAYAMTMDPSLKEPATRAINYLRKKMVKSGSYTDYGCGWSYHEPDPSRIDTNATSACILAMRAGQSAGLDIGNTLEGSRDWWTEAWQSVNKNAERIHRFEESTFPSTWNAKLIKTESRRREASLGAYTAIFLRMRPGEKRLDTLINAVVKELPQKYPCNTLTTYLNTISSFQYGGEQFQKWRAAVIPVLLKAQHGQGTGCFNGSWDYEDTIFHGHETGRLLSTALCCLTLEVFSRYDRVMIQKKNR